MRPLKVKYLHKFEWNHKTNIDVGDAGVFQLSSGISGIKLRIPKIRVNNVIKRNRKYDNDKLIRFHFNKHEKSVTLTQVQVQIDTTNCHSCNIKSKSKSTGYNTIDLVSKATTTQKNYNLYRYLTINLSSTVDIYIRILDSN